jgi:hypothetical protein
MHCARLAEDQGLPFAFETEVYDLGELVLSMGRQDEERAVEEAQAFLEPW